MGKKVQFLFKSPNHRFVKICIISGIPWINYAKWCEENKFGKISEESYNAFTNELKKDKTVAKLIEHNQHSYLNGGRSAILRSIRSKFKFAKVFDQLFLDLSSSFNKDPANWLTSTALNYFLNSYQRRQFTECGLLTKTTFFELNKLWKKFNQVGLDLEYFHIYHYFFWDIKTLTSPEIDYFLKDNMIECNYQLHREVVGGSFGNFKAAYGMQSAVDRLTSIRRLANKSINRIIDSSGEAERALITLNRECSALINRDLSNKLRPASSGNNLLNCQQERPKVNPAARKMREKNREYKFSLVVELIKKGGGQIV